MPSRSTIWRRRCTALGALAALAVLAAWALAAIGGPGGQPFWRQISGTGATTKTIRVRSSALGRRVKVDVILPPGDLAGRPLVVDLHGKGSKAPSAGDFAAGLDVFDELGDRAPVVVLASDDGDSYWHDRRTGRWGTYVARDLVRAVRKRYALSEITALSGLSMGGSGVLTAALSHPGEFCAVVASSPALWTDGGLSAAGAYDDAEDYAATNPFALFAATPRALASTPLWIDIGDRDPFLQATRAFATKAKPTTPGLRFTVEPGGHDGHFWRARYPRYMRWLAERLATCGAAAKSTAGDVAVDAGSR